MSGNCRARHAIINNAWNGLGSIVICSSLILQVLLRRLNLWRWRWRRVTHCGVGHGDGEVVGAVMVGAVSTTGPLLVAPAIQAVPVMHTSISNITRIVKALMLIMTMVPATIAAVTRTAAAMNTAMEALTLAWMQALALTLVHLMFAPLTLVFKAGLSVGRMTIKHASFKLC